MTEREEKLHRTWTELLLERGRRELASIAVECEVEVSEEEMFDGAFSSESVTLSLPPSAHEIVTENEEVYEELLDYLHEVCAGNVYEQQVPREGHIETKMKLLEVGEDWKEEMRRLISEAKGSNQGVISGKVAKREGRDTHTYNEMTFGSKSEIRIAQELETRDLLFFPLPLGVRAETGDRWKDRREPDFLVCQNGTWGILEVAYHPDRYEKDAEKAGWFKEMGILCVEHVTAERCYNQPADVVDDFLNVLSKHRD
jgi:hypothetical protein